jgi:hypothetical protein
MSRLVARSFPRAEVVGVDLREQYLNFARERDQARLRAAGLAALGYDREAI